MKSVCSLKYRSDEAVQARMDRIVAVTTALNDVPYVRNTVLSEVVVIALRGIESDNVIGVTAHDEY